MKTSNHEGHDHKERLYRESERPDSNEKQDPQQESSNGRPEFSPPSGKPEIDTDRYGRHNEESPTQPEVSRVDPNVNQPAPGV